MDADLDPASFELLRGEAPWNLIDRHPDGRHLALQADGGSDLKAGVWDRVTGKLVWAPPGAVAICWMLGGEQVVVLWEHYQYDPSLHIIIGSPLQREFTYYLERMTWPGRERISICEVRPPTSWLNLLAVSLQGDLATYSYNEQHCSGVEIVSLGEDGDRQVPGGGYQTDIGITQLAFSPDGRSLVILRENLGWWNEDFEEPSPGGVFDAGTLILYDVEARTYREIPIRASAPAGWCVKWSDLAYENMFVSRMRFTSADEVAFTTPMGQELHFRLS